MNAVPPEYVFSVRAAAKGDTVLFLEDEAAPVEAALMRELRRLPPGGRIVVDFDGMRVASAAARKILKRALETVRGAPEGQSIVLSRLGPSRYSVKVMLESERLTAVERPESGRGPSLIGREEGVAAETYGYLAKKESVTAGELREEFDLKSTSVATNRLFALAERGLAVRVAQEAVEGGGMQYRYAAVK